MTDGPESRARYVGGLLLGAVALWILHGFLTPLAWAVVLGIATWPLHRRYCGDASLDRIRPVVSGALLTAMIGGILMGPLTFGLLKVAEETQSLIQLLRAAPVEGVPPPEWLTRLPAGAAWAQHTWSEWLGSSDAVRGSLEYLTSGRVLAQTKAFAAQIAHRYFVALFTIVTLFFVYRDGLVIGEQVLLLSDRVFGRIGREYVLHAVAAVRATVNGIVLVALGEGIALGFAYAAAGLQHAAVLGAVTAMAALVPFAAKLVVLGAAAVLFAYGEATAAIGLVIYGVAVVLVADNYVRPALIGGAVQLPFLWTLLGILGGIETFGLLGLFLGPTVMAILMSVWRDWLSGATLRSPHTL